MQHGNLLSHLYKEASAIACDPSDCFLWKARTLITNVCEDAEMWGILSIFHWSPRTRPPSPPACPGPDKDLRVSFPWTRSKLLPGETSRRRPDQVAAPPSSSTGRWRSSGSEHRGTQEPTGAEPVECLGFCPETVRCLWCVISWGEQT